MSETLRLALAAVAVFRLAQLVVLDDGPFRIFARFRDWACTLPVDSFLRKLLAGYNCPPNDGILFCCYCCGVWASGLVAVLVLFPSWPGDVILVVLGIAGAAVFMERITGHY